MRQEVGHTTDRPVPALQLGPMVGPVSIRPLVTQVWSVRVAVIFAEVERILLLDGRANRFSILSINSSNEATRAATFSIHNGRKDPDRPPEWEELKRERGLWPDM